jgi:hypothetical protein
MKKIEVLAFDLKESYELNPKIVFTLFLYKFFLTSKYSAGTDTSYRVLDFNKNRIDSK